MATAGDRFRGWVNDRATEWGGRLGGWLLTNIGNGITKSLEDQEPGIIEQTRETIQKVIDNPQTPEATRRMLEKSLAQGNIFHVVMGWILSIIGLLPAMLGLGQPIGNIFNHVQELALRSQILDPETAIRIWRRDPAQFAKYLEDIKYTGFDDERIEALKFATLFYPGPQDLVRFQAREVFEPEMRSRYGLDDEFDKIDLEPFRKAGMTDEITRYYWRAHWEHASWIQVVEMLHRGQLTEDQVYDWFRLVEIPPFWRDKLIAVSWNVPTRVDVRRFYDLRTIDETRLREIYTAMGYHDKDLDDYVLWTKIYVELPDLIARWKNGWITLDDARVRLTTLGLSAEAAEELIQTKVKVEEPADIAETKALTKSEVYKAVKQGKISRTEGVELLQDLEYSRDKAELLIDINVPADETDQVVEERKLSKADIKAALKAAVITEAEAREKLAELRYSAANINLLVRIFQAAIKPPEEETQRQASKADIVEGVKKGVISPEEGYVMLTEIGFSPEASNFILSVRVEESPFSPIDFTEFKALTSKYRQVVGMVSLPVPDELQEAAQELVRIEAEVKSLERSVEEERRQLTDEETAPEPARKKLTELQVALNRGRAELERVKLKYDGLVAAWKRGG